VNTFRIITLIVLLLLFACAPKKSEIPMTEVPAGPLLQSLEQRQHSFSTLKAIASLEVRRGGRKRTFDTVGIVLDAQRRLRVEAFGPLGQSIATLVWNGGEFLLRLPDEEGIRHPGQAGIEKLLGVDMDGSELGPAITGIVPAPDQSSIVRAFCGQDNACMVEISRGDIMRRVRVLSAPAGHAETVTVSGQELYRAGTLAYQARYSGTQDGNTAFMPPRSVTIENPSNDSALAIVYAETEVNVPVDQALFTLSGKEAGSQ
jgi:hypothetical protein